MFVAALAVLGAIGFLALTVHPFGDGWVESGVLVVLVLLALLETVLRDTQFRGRVNAFARLARWRAHDPALGVPMDVPPGGRRRRARGPRGPGRRRARPRGPLPLGRALQPRLAGEALFQRYPGGCHFAPDPAAFVDTPIDPLPNAVPGTDDPFGDVVDAAADHGIDVHAWTVCLHNSRLGAEHPAYRIEDAFGNAHEHALCPSNPDVRAYFAGVARSIADYDVGEIQLESVGFPSVLHGHDTTFGHDKRQVLTSPAEEWLLSGCFCEACRDAMAGTVDADAAQELVQSILRDSFADPHSDPPSLAALAREHDVLDALFSVRADVIDALLGRLDDAAGDVPLNYYLMDGPGGDAGDGWPAGVTLETVEERCDRVTAICYASDSTRARERLRTLRRSVDLPVDAGVTLDPDLIGSEAELHALLDAVRAETEGRVSVYHHSLATEAQLDWISRSGG